MIVPFTEERRDYFLRMLQTGDAAEQQRAIFELKQFYEEKAYQAIQAAAQEDNATPAFSYDVKGEHLITAANVREEARAAIDRIEE